MNLSRIKPARVALAAVALAAMGVVQYWQADTAANVKQQVQELRQSAAAVAEIQPVEIKLPEDGQAYHTSVILSPGWEQSDRQRSLVGWFSTEPRLSSLKAQTHWHEYVTTDPIYVSNLASTAPKAPAVVIQDASGKVHYAAWEGGQLPQTPTELGNHVGRLFGNCPDNSCRPRPKPQPDQTPVVPDKPLVPVVPDAVQPIVPAQPADDNFPWLLLILACAASGAGALVVQIRKEFQGK
jgi:hypothetical protein